jgi:hypothetical protein
MKLHLSGEGGHFGFELSLNRKGSLMKPKTEKTSFGQITIDGHTYQHDVLIRLEGDITKRKKKLSKQVYGTSHTISLDEARYIFQEGAAKLIIGTGQYGLVNLSEEAANFFKEKGLRVVLEPTPKAIKLWNQTDEKMIGLYHVTC